MHIYSGQITYSSKIFSFDWSFGITSLIYFSSHFGTFKDYKAS